MSSACSIQILFRDIAEWLHPSDFYQLLLELSNDADENDLVTVPYYEHSHVIQQGDADQLKRVLQTCRYWGLELQDWPDELCYVLWGIGGYWYGIDKIVHQLYPTLSIGPYIYSISVNDNLRALQYAHEQDCPWTDYTCIKAASKGHLQCLQYAHEHGCPWNESTCSHAAWKGQLVCLQYAHEHGCPWNVWICCNAARNGQLECLQYAHEHGCPIDWNDCRRVAQQHNIIHYLLEHQPNKCVIN